MAYTMLITRNRFTSLLIVALKMLLMGANLSSAMAQSNAFTAEGQANAANMLTLEAKLVDKGATIQQGMIWRVYGLTTAKDGKLPLIASSEGGTAKLKLATGSYLVHAALGRASVSKQVLVNSGSNTETFVLNAGGLELNATSAGSKLPDSNLRFAIYKLEQDEEGNRELIALNVAASKVVPLNAGTYHVLSRYGTINATVRADLEVKAGSLTKATLEHRGAELSMRLVSQRGGDPLANTSWTVFTEDGEKVFSSSSVSPSVILAEGSYEAVVRFGERTSRQKISIKPGKPHLLEIVIP